MTFDQMQALFIPGMIARRITWERHFTLQMKEGDVVRLHDKRDPKFCPEWKKSGYDADADDYVFSVQHAKEWVTAIPRVTFNGIKDQ